MTRVISIANQKGGVGKTTTAVHLGMGLAREGKKVLLIDLDAQANLTISLGYQNPDTLGTTIADIMGKVIDKKTLIPGEGILHHAEGIDLMPSSIQLSGMDTLLVNTMSRENILKTYINTVKPKYDNIIIDCMPSLSMLTINALAAADSVIIPVQPHFLSAKGLELLLKTVGKVRKQINPNLKIDGILLSMADKRANFMRDTQWHFIVVMGGLYGLRRNEVLGLKWQDIDLQNKRFNIVEQLANRSYQQKTGKLTADLKESYSLRTLPITDDTMPFFVQQKEHYQEKMFIFSLFEGLEIREAGVL